MDEILEMLADNGKALDTQKIIDFIKGQAQQITAITEEIAEKETIIQDHESTIEAMKEAQEKEAQEVELAKNQIINRTAGLIETTDDEKTAKEFRETAAALSVEETIKKLEEAEKKFDELFKIERISSPPDDQFAKALTLREIQNYKV